MAAQKSSTKPTTAAKAPASAPPKSSPVTSAPAQLAQLQGADAGWLVAPTGGASVKGWLTKFDWVKRGPSGEFVEGYVWRGKLTDAFMVRGEKGLNAALAFALTAAPHPDRQNVKRKDSTTGALVETRLAVGDVVAFSEKGQLAQARTFRGLRLGQEFLMRVTGEKSVGKPSPLQLFHVALAPTPGAGALIQDLLTASHASRSGAAKDPWADGAHEELPPEMPEGYGESTAAEPGSEG